MSLLTASTPARALAGSTRIHNDTGRTITVYWHALGCFGVDGIRTGVCRSQDIVHGASASYTWPSSASGKTVSASCVRTTLGVPELWSVGHEATFTSATECGKHDGAPRREYFKLVNRKWGNCLDVAHADAAKGRAIGLWYCEPEDDQVFYMDGTRLRSAKSDQVVDVVGSEANAGDALILWDADDGFDQKWYVPGGPWGAIRLAAASEKCVTATDRNSVALGTCSAPVSPEAQFARVNVRL